MIVVCDMENCKFNDSGFCARETLAIKIGGVPNFQVPACDMYVSQSAGSKGVFYPNEFAQRKKKIDLNIETPEFHEPEAEQNDEN